MTGLLQNWNYYCWSRTEKFQLESEIYSFNDKEAWRLLLWGSNAMSYSINQISNKQFQRLLICPKLMRATQYHISKSFTTGKKIYPCQNTHKHSTIWRTFLYLRLCEFDQTWSEWEPEHQNPLKARWWTGGRRCVFAQREPPPSRKWWVQGPARLFPWHTGTSVTWTHPLVSSIDTTIGNFPLSGILVSLNNTPLKKQTIIRWKPRFPTTPTTVMHDTPRWLSPHAHTSVSIVFIWHHFLPCRKWTL